MAIIPSDNQNSAWVANSPKPHTRALAMISSKDPVGGARAERHAMKYGPMVVHSVCSKRVLCMGSHKLRNRASRSSMP